MKWREILFVAIIGALALQAEGAKKKTKKKKEADNFYSGTTPSGSTVWKSEAKGVIYTDVDTSHLKFDRVPKYFCSVTIDTRKYLSVNATLETLSLANPLVNVTGKNTPVKPTTSGFRVRLRYNSDMGKDLTDSVARLGGWRVRWAAVTEGHPVFESAREDVQNEKYDDGIDEKPVGQSLGYIKMLELLAKEDDQLVASVLGKSEFQLPLSKRPKPKPKPKPADKKDETKSEESKKDETEAKDDKEGGDQSEEEEAEKEKEEEATA